MAILPSYDELVDQHLSLAIKSGTRIKELEDKILALEEELRQTKEVGALYFKAYNELINRRPSPKMYSGTGIDNIYFDDMEHEKDD